MTTFVIAKKLNANPGDTWLTLSGIGNIADYHPEVEKSFIVNHVPRGIGSRAEWVFYDKKGKVVEEISQFDEGKSFTVKFVEGDIPLVYAHTSFSLEELSSSSVEIEIRMKFKLKGGFLGDIVGFLLFRPMLKKRMGNFLIALEAHMNREHDSRKASDLASD